MVPWRTTPHRLRVRHCWALLFSFICVGCDKVLVVGVCEPGEGSAPDGGDDDAGSVSASISLPWASGFEDGFCDFRRVGGFCYQRGAASYKLVTSPVHSGTFAAAFTVSSDASASGTQARCARQGTLPERAYYGAWYYVPPVRIESGIWDLFHFQGGQSAGGDLHGLWDVQLVQDSSGQLRLSVYDFLRQRQIELPSAAPIPIDFWFHLKFYFARASDTTGEITVLQDDQPVLDLTGIETDDSQWQQWYVGSYATGLSPPQATVYVDDVTIDAVR